MHDVDGNGWIDLLEMTKMVRSIYQVKFSELSLGGPIQPLKIRRQRIVAYDIVHT